ncbi:MAG TPA: hypothetical protein VLM11_04815 [Streptosporangiaceae bacterium]|nr:hypothetical protein [Streptosporangiaceae bacterium]
MAASVVADQLEDAILNQPPEKAKALLRLLVHELRVQSRSEIHPHLQGRLTSG